MKRNDIVIDNLIIRSSAMTIKLLKEELKIKKNISLIHILMRYLISSIAVVDFSSDLNQCLYILKVLNYIKPENESEFQIIEDYIKRIRELIDKKKNLFVNNQILFEFLKILEEKLACFLIDTCFELNNKINKIENFSADEEKLKEVIHDFIFKYSDYVHLNMLMSLYPNACNIRYGEKTIIIKILKRYFSKPIERDFLSRVITLFISNTNYSISLEEKKEIAELCNRYILFLNSKDLIFIKEIITSLAISQEINYGEKLNLLKTRFGIEDINDINFRFSYESFPVNMTNRNVITIDCSGVLVRDDAFSIERKSDGGYELGLYITDVSAIKEGSTIDTYAFNHFSTIYTKDTWLPMIAEPLVYEFSLDEGLRRVMAFTFRFSKDLQLIDCEIASAIINVKKNLTYNDSVQILSDGGDLYSILRNALNLSEAIGDSLGTIDRYHRIKQVVRELGGIIGEIPEKYLDTPGNRIISTFAVFLNNYIAKIFDASKLPFIYRVNEAASPDIIQLQLRKYRYDKAICNILKRIQSSYKPSTFSSINTGHSGLGLDAYTQATNPARLYPSLFIQRMLMDLFVYKIPIEEYIKKYGNVELYAQEFALRQQRNLDFRNEYDRLCKRLNLDKS